MIWKKNYWESLELELELSVDITSTSSWEASLCALNKIIFGYKNMATSIKIILTVCPMRLSLYWHPLTYEVHRMDAKQIDFVLTQVLLQKTTWINFNRIWFKWPKEKYLQHFDEYHSECWVVVHHVHLCLARTCLKILNAFQDPSDRAVWDHLVAN